MIYRPVRRRSQEEIVEAAGEIIRNCGYEEISLLSLSSSDYPGIDELVKTLLRRYQDYPLALSLPSLRMDTFSVKLMDSVKARKKPGLTFAPEAGSERLRHVINKSITDDDILSTVCTALNKGWTGFKLYFMIGLPTETDEDIGCTIQLINKMIDIKNGKKPRIRISLTTFIPKPHTPFQWAAQCGEDEIDKKYQFIRQGVRRKGVHLSWPDPKENILEGVMSRGDRRLSKVIHRAWQLGCKFDAWSEHFNFEKWMMAFHEQGIDPSFYVYRQRPLEEIMPWAHLDMGISEAYLKQEYNLALQGIVTTDCGGRICNSCGLEKWQIECQVDQSIKR
jgi:radical SAM superfamily enzyme YgiQ (UPF0313 family)